MTVKKQIEKYQRESGFSIEELAKQCDVSYMTMLKLLNEEYPSVSTKTLQRVAKGMDCELIVKFKGVTK